MKDSKTCARCKRELPATNEFFCYNGAPRLRSHCKECDNAAARSKRNRVPTPYRGDERRCSACKTYKPANLDHFSTGQDSRRLSSRCKACINAAHAAHRAANPTTYGLATKRWNARNAERNRETRRAYRRARPEISKVADSRRRALKKGCGGSFTAGEWHAKVEQYKGRCHWCGTKVKGKLHADHLIPLSKGGGNTIGNIVPACQSCNLSKWNKMPSEWCGRLL